MRSSRTRRNQSIIALIIGSTVKRSTSMFRSRKKLCSAASRLNELTIEVHRRGIYSSPSCSDAYTPNPLSIAEITSMKAAFFMRHGVPRHLRNEEQHAEWPVREGRVDPVDAAEAVRDERQPEAAVDRSSASPTFRAGPPRFPVAVLRGSAPRVCTPTEWRITGRSAPMLRRRTIRGSG